MNSNTREHKIIFKKIDGIILKQSTIGEDVAIIKSYLIGNGREGLIKKVDRHDRALYMIAGGASLVGFAMAAVKAFG